MSSQASARRAVSHEPEEFDRTKDDGKTLTQRWQIWKQVVLAEVLNLLERRRYDLKASR
jgi:hypothetical protein